MTRKANTNNYSRVKSCSFSDIASSHLRYLCPTCDSSFRNVVAPKAFYAFVRALASYGGGWDGNSPISRIILQNAHSTC